MGRPFHFAKQRNTIRMVRISPIETVAGPQGKETDIPDYTVSTANQIRELDRD